MGWQLTLLVIHLLVLAVGFLLLYRIPRCGGQPSDDTARTLSVSIIIPARNEEDNLPHLLKSLDNQIPSPHEVLVIDDASTDRTATVASEAGARVIPAGVLPAGWTGKTHACWRGAREASGELLLFMDADTWLEPTALSHILATWQQCGGALSIAAFHCVQKPYESLSAFFTIVMTASMNAFAAWSPRARADGLFGPFLLISRTDYHRCGGHAAVKEHILENLHLAKLLRQHEIPTRNFGGEGVLSIRMYPSGLQDLIQGWSKAFASGASCTPLMPRLLIILWLSAAAGAFTILVVSLFFANWLLPLWLVIYVLFAAQTAWNLKRLGTFPLITSLLYPLPLFFFFSVFAYSLTAPQKTWKQRNVDAK